MLYKTFFPTVLSRSEFSLDSIGGFDTSCAPLFHSLSLVLYKKNIELVYKQHIYLLCK